MPMKIDKKLSIYDYKDQIMAVVNALYANGNDARSQKNGKPDTFVDKLLDSGNIIVVGLWHFLPQNYQAMISNKMTIPESDQKLLFKFLLKFANTYDISNPKTAYFCYLSSDVTTAMDCFIQDQSNKNINYITKFHKYFQDTERQKVAGSANNKYSFNESQREISISKMKALVE